MIADIGHFESEQFTMEIFHDLLTKKFPNFAVHFSEVNTNPIHYFK
jgi:putative NIF3 family GTP cyclohydrolase 1 type 2